MNYRLTSISVGAAVALGLIDIGLEASNNPSVVVQAAEMSALTVEKAGLKSRPGSALAEIENMDLTTAQQDEIEAIKADMTVQMADVLTPAQMEAFQQRQAEGGDMRSMMMSLDQGQRSSVMGIMRTAQADLMDVLTPEQRAQIEGGRPLDRN
ncbi:MAG: Spy/CpxP family protein refolding chaperone [Cyanobacteria bacterium J06626_6]